MDSATRESATGTLSVLHDGTYYTWLFPGRGWMAAELVGFLDEVCQSEQQPLALLKLLGYTVQMTDERPPRSPRRHWVEVDLQARRLETNSPLIRLAVDQQPPEKDAPYGSLSLRRIHDVLDRYDFTVKLYRFGAG